MSVVSPVSSNIMVKARCPKHLSGDVQRVLTAFQQGYAPKERAVFDIVDLPQGCVGVSVREIGLFSFLKSKFKREKPQYIITPRSLREGSNPAWIVAFENTYSHYKGDKNLRKLKSI